MNKPILEVTIPGIPRCDRGKIRDVFKVGEDILVVTTDRVYLFDQVYPEGLAGKGRTLTALTLRTFELTGDILPNFLITSRVEEFPPPLNDYPEMLAERSLLTEEITPIRLECVARGYLYGQAWQAYRDGDRSWMPQIPDGLELAGELPHPIFTPARKDLGNNDENLSWDDLIKLVGEERAEKVRDLTLKIYERMREVFARAGFILGDTKFEFGEKDGRILLINEACTPDCSRIWRESEYRPGRIQDTWDKEIMEDYLKAAGWSPGDPPIPLPTGILEKTRERFAELVSLI
jgi:phosphoribosylaminoimidazole-succinocarboxamide synthase